MKIVKHSLPKCSNLEEEILGGGSRFNSGVMALADSSSDSDGGPVDSNQHLPYVDAFKQVKLLRGVAGQQRAYLYKCIYIYTDTFFGFISLTNIFSMITFNVRSNKHRDSCWFPTISFHYSHAPP